LSQGNIDLFAPRSHENHDEDEYDAGWRKAEGYPLGKSIARSMAKNMVAPPTKLSPPYNLKGYAELLRS